MSSETSSSGGWQARCSGCNKLGEYIAVQQNSSSQTSYRQHNANNKYCGLFKIDPQPILLDVKEEKLNVTVPSYSNKSNSNSPPSSSSTPPSSSPGNNNNNNMDPKVKMKVKIDKNYMLADCSGCGQEGEYWVRLYRDQNFHRLHLVYSAGGGPTSGKFCGNYSENPRYSVQFALYTNTYIYIYNIYIILCSTIPQ